MNRFSLEKMLAAFMVSFQGWRRKAVFISISLLTYFFFTFNTNIPWNTELLFGNTLGFTKVISIGTETMLQGGITNLALKVIYSLIIPATLINFGIQLRSKNFNKHTLTAMLPGFIAGGCGCGIGLLGFLGVAGAVTALPFQGNLVLLAGLILMIYSLNTMGDPDNCEINVSIK